MAGEATFGVDLCSLLYRGVAERAQLEGERTVGLELIVARSEGCMVLVCRSRWAAIWCTRRTHTDACNITQTGMLKRFGDAAISHMVTQLPDDPSHLDNTRKIQRKGLSSPATYALTTLLDGKTEMCTLLCHRPPRHSMRRKAPRVPRSAPPPL